MQQHLRQGFLQQLATKILPIFLIFSLLSPPLAAFAEEETATTTPASETVMVSTTPSTETATTQNENSNDDEDDSDTLDLGDDQTELDAQKDFTGVVRQSKPYTCGPAALATLLTQLGNDTSENEVLEYITPDADKGINFLALKQAAQKLGSNVALKTWSADDVLAYVQDTDDPVLIHDEKTGVGGHFSVLRGYHADKETVELSDTEAGNITYSVADFRHIFTGSVLVVYEGEPTAQLNDEKTNLSDDQAAAIWGKYVPVSLLAEQSGNAKAAQDAQTFKNCISRAMTITNYQSRNAARQSCYSALAASLKTDLGNAEEAKFMASFDTSLLNPFSNQNEAGVGTAEILGVLHTAMSNQDAYNRNLVQFNQALQQGGGSLANLATFQSQLSTLQTKLSQAQADRDLLSSSLTSKQVAATLLQNELFSGLFVENNQTFSLGAVGNQLTAQAATYQKLSQALTSKLANLDAQVNQKQASINSYAKSRDNTQSQAASANAQANSWLSQMNTKKAQKKSYSYEQQQYQSYLTQAANATSNANYYQSLVNQATNDIANLKNQKSQAQTEVSSASAEKARLERLKAFGDQEVQRKKNLLQTLNDNLASLKTQLTAKNATIASLQPQITPFQAKVQALQSAQSYQSQMNFSAQQIDGIKQRYGFTTLTYTNTAEAQRLITEELAFEKGQDTTAEVAATMDFRGQGQKVIDDTANKLNLSCASLAASSLVIVVLAPVAGTACATAIAITTPITLIEGIRGTKLLTQEELSTFQRILDVGSGTLAIAGTAGKVFLTVGRNAKVAGTIAALASDGTVAGERELQSAESLLQSAVRSKYYVDLIAQEGVNGGHVLEEHVRDAAYLLERIAKNETKFPSTFFTKDIAEKEINKAITNNLDKITRWLATAKEGSTANDIINGYETGANLGFGFNGSALDRVDNISKLTVVFKKVSSQVSGFIVYTAYPLVK